MMLSWRKRRLSRRSNNGKQQQQQTNETIPSELSIPSHFRCPISLDLMKDPVTLSTGITYDRQSIETWIESGNATCPTTKRPLLTLEPVPNHAVRKMIQQWCVQNKSFGVERIPTPRIPISSDQALNLLLKLSDSARKLSFQTDLFIGSEEDHIGRNIITKIRAAMRESERNRRCFVAAGATLTLANAFEAFARVEEEYIAEEILSCLTMVISPFGDEEAKEKLRSEFSTRCLIRFMESGDLSRRRNSVLVVKHVATPLFSRFNGGLEALVKMVREPICPASTKASLTALYHVAKSDDNNETRARLVNMGLVSLALEILVDYNCHKSLCEKALLVLDGLAECLFGRAEARQNALAVPVLVKKILRVSDLSTELSISILWRLCRRNDDDGESDNDENINKAVVGAAVEALQVGAFQKLLLVLQVGCGGRVKEKTGELLRVLNLHRGKVECIDSMDFKDLKRPF